MKNIIILLFSICCIYSVAEGQPRNLLIIVDGKYGFCNDKGKIVIQPVYDYAREFSDGLAAVKKANFWGYIDESGKVTIDLKYQQAFAFSNGYCVVEKPNGNCEVLDTKGIDLFKKEFQYAMTFLEGSMLVGIDEKFGFIDTKGNLVIDYKYESCVYTGQDGDTQLVIKYFPFGFHEGFAPVMLNGKSTFIDKNGKPLTAFIFDLIDYFKHGLAKVLINDKFGIIDTSGKYIVKPENDSISDFLGSYIALEKKGKYGFINEKGNVTIPFQYDFAESFRGDRGLIAIKYDKNKLKYGFVDKTGKIIIKPQFDKAYTFTTDGYAIVELGDSAGIIDTDGKYIIPLLKNIRFDPIEGARDEDHLYKNRNYVIDGVLIYINSITGKKGMMKINSEKITSPEFYQVEPFKNGIAKVETGDFDENGMLINKTYKTGYIDMSGKYIWKPTN